MLGGEPRRGLSVHDLAVGIAFVPDQNLTTATEALNIFWRLKIFGLEIHGYYILLFYPDKVAVLVDAVDVKFPCPEVEEGINVGDVVDEEDGGGAAVERVRDRAIPLLAAGVPHDEPEQSDF